MRSSSKAAPWGGVIWFGFVPAASLIYLDLCRMWPLGKRLMRLHVVGLDGARPPWAVMAFREAVLKWFLIDASFGILALGGPIAALADRRRRALHDRVARTVVVHRPRSS